MNENVESVEARSILADPSVNLRNPGTRARRVSQFSSGTPFRERCFRSKCHRVATRVGAVDVFAEVASSVPACTSESVVVRFGHGDLDVCDPWKGVSKDDVRGNRPDSLNTSEALCRLSRGDIFAPFQIRRTRLAPVNDTPGTRPQPARYATGGTIPEWAPYISSMASSPSRETRDREP
jgi:hypothetical protein